MSDELTRAAAWANVMAKVHRVRVDSTWWDVLGWECSYRYQAKCRCGWYGDETKSKVTAEKQAEWHLDAKLSHA